MGATLKRPPIRDVLTIDTGSSPDVVTVTLPTDLDPTKTILQFTVRSSSNDPSENWVSGQITGSLGSAALRFRRNTNVLAAPVVSYELLEFDSGVTVQRGTVSHNGFSDTGADFTQNITLSAITVAKSFPLLTHSNSGSNYGHDDFIKCELTSTTNLRLSHSDSDIASTATNDIDWQVVSFSDATVTAYYSGSLAAADDSMTAAISSVTLGRSIVLLGYVYEGGVVNNSAADCFLTAKFNSATQLQIDRVGATAAAFAVTWGAWVIQFDTDASVISGSSQIASGQTTLAVSHASADVDASALFLSGPYGTSGRSSNTVNGSEGPYAQVECHSRTATGFTAERSGTAGYTTNFEWFLVQFPMAANTFRPQIIFFM